MEKPETQVQDARVEDPDPDQQKDTEDWILCFMSVGTAWVTFYPCSIQIDKHNHMNDNKVVLDHQKLYDPARMDMVIWLCLPLTPRIRSWAWHVIHACSL